MFNDENIVFSSSSDDSEDEQEEENRVRRRRVSIKNYIETVGWQYSDNEFQQHFQLYRTIVYNLIGKFPLEIYHIQPEFKI